MIYYLEPFLAEQKLKKMQSWRKFILAIPTAFSVDTIFLIRPKSFPFSDSQQLALPIQKKFIHAVRLKTNRLQSSPGADQRRIDIHIAAKAVAFFLEGFELFFRFGITLKP